MSRAKGRRTWIKLYCYQRLHGSVSYQLTEEEQSVWDKLMCLAGLCSYKEGLISDNDGKPFPHLHIAQEIHTTEELLESTLTKCKSEGRISENDNGIHITNWVAYQSEYERQKPYREAKKVKEQLPLKEEPILSELCRNYESEIGTISAVIGQELTDFATFCKERSMPLNWISEAFAEAAKNNKRSWAYVKAILKTWVEQGKGGKHGTNKRGGRELPERYTTPEEFRRSHGAED